MMNLYRITYLWNVARRKHAVNSFELIAVGCVPLQAEKRVVVSVPADGGDYSDHKGGWDYVVVVFARNPFDAIGLADEVYPVEIV